MAEKPERRFAKDFLEKWARAEREQGPADEALRKVEAALKDRPDDPGLWFRRGTLLLDLERWQDALHAFQRVESVDPNFARLYVALAFVLGKLERFDESVAAQRKALAAATGGEAPAEGQGIEEAFASLAQDLLEQATEERVVRDLEELGEVTREPEPVEEDVEAKLRAWEAAGYDLRPLREVIEREPDRARTAMFQFEQNVRKVQILNDTVDGLAPEGLEAEIARMRALFTAPYQIWKIEAEMATLLEKADARDRTDRVRTLPSPEPARPTPRAVGATNGRPPTPGRVNGLTAPRGRVNGQTASVGRVNGLPKAVGQGRVNGLVNGFRRGRAGLTNGLTNGMGFTNGLGGRRFAVEARARRARLFLVPLIALSLLFVPFFLPEPGRGGVQVDGTFSDWQGIRGYQQNSSATNPNVDLATYKTDVRDGVLSVYAAVRGAMFTATQGMVEMRVFVDMDGNRLTGYDDGRLGADVLLELAGYNGTISTSDVREWTGNASDTVDWNGWGVAGIPFAAAARGSEVECQLDFTDFVARGPRVPLNASRAEVSLVINDQEGSGSSNALLMGTSFGALEVAQSSASSQVLAAPSNFLVLQFRAIGREVRVSDLTLDLGPDTPSLTGFVPFTLAADAVRTVTLQLDGSALPLGTLVSASLSAVSADAPATITGEGARAYVAQTPAGPVVDGLFDEWGTYLNDTQAPLRDPNVDILRYAQESRTTIAFTYLLVRGEALAGTASPSAKVRPSTGGGASAPPGPPSPAVRQSGEDAIDVYYQRNGTTGGVSIGGIVANVHLEVRGHHGRVRSATAFVWSNGWQAQGAAAAIAVGDQFEASLDVPGIDLSGAQYVIKTLDWKNVGDLTVASGVRGTRSIPAGVTFYDSYKADLPLAADGSFRFATPRGPGFAWQLPRIMIGRDGVRILVADVQPVPLVQAGMAGHYSDVYAGLGVDVLYGAQPGTLKETFTFSTPPAMRPEDDLVLELPFVLDPGLLMYASGTQVSGDVLVNGTLSFVDGRGLSIDLLPPWIEDASGSRIEPRLRVEMNRLAIEIPGGWLSGATYPVVLDPTTTYTLQDNGPTYKLGENMGYSVAIGDFNGDGYADVLTGAPNWKWGNHTLIGYAYIYYGPFSADKTTPDVRFNGTTIDFGRFGWAVAAGKFNNDNYWDALIAHLSTSAGTGPVDIFFGSSTLSGDVSTPDVKFEPPSSPNSFGYSLGAGNIDNASFDDVLIAESGRDNSNPPDSTADGVVYLYKSPFASDVTTANYTLLPTAPQGGQLGRGGIAVGKIDSDAYPDIIVGEPRWTNGSGNGRVQYYEGSNFLSGSGNRLPDASLTYQSAGENFGGSVAVGLLDGDSYADVVVGGPLKTPATGGNGAVYIFVANSNGSGLTSGASPTQTLPFQSASENFGNSVFVLDFSNTGMAGVIVGAPLANATGTRRGSAYWFNTPLTNTTPTDTMSGSQSNERFGWSLGGGRFSSDTRTLLAIGAYLWDKNPANNLDNDGRVVAAFVPEPATIMFASILVLGVASRSLQRRRLVRQRRELGL